MFRTWSTNMKFLMFSEYSKCYKAVLCLVALEILYLSISVIHPWVPLPYDGVTRKRYKICDVPYAGFKGWKEGVVTAIRPNIKKNCSKIISGNEPEIELITQLSSDWKEKYSNEMYSQQAYDTLLEKSTNCEWSTEYLTNNLYNSQLEDSFPVAYNFLVYDNPQQFLRLLKLLYRPQNVYCIHPDKKSAFNPFFINIAKCFHNIIIASELIDVHWGQYTLMDAQMRCLSDLLNYREKYEEDRWKYVINLCGKELPLLSTKEIVKKLVSMNGTSSVVAWPIPKSEWWTMKRLREKQLPYSLTFYKSMTYNALSEPFVRFLVRNSTAQSLYQFFRKTDFPEEHLYATLFHMPGAPGGYNANIAKEKYFEVSHYFWRSNKEEIALPCYGLTVHSMCVVNHADIPRIMQETKNGSTALFHNKFFMEINHVVMDCMEERIVAMNKLEYDIDCSNSPSPSLQHGT